MKFFEFTSLILKRLYSSEMKMQQGGSERRVYKRKAHTQATSNDAASSFPMSIEQLRGSIMVRYHAI